ncbi:hypothetical protein HPB52_014899 [Rhipicephalus sanguineus]|uniref:FERM domain-containing protein n=1 Tax=Rhipicephalus sanguineus TaxID=34632 RepID=A0A9D4Q1F9_RHISA|nr:hypothetical protein HPB52_014899 [Rhipicephalus sanguineus]
MDRAFLYGMSSDAFPFQSTSRGQDLLDVVYKHLNLLETAYFGLRFVDTLAQTHWLDPNKKIHRQVKGMQTFTFYFGVKFYTPDPCKLLEEITRLEIPYGPIGTHAENGQIQAASKYSPDSSRHLCECQAGDTSDGLDSLMVLMVTVIYVTSPQFPFASHFNTSNGREPVSATLGRSKTEGSLLKFNKPFTTVYSKLWVQALPVIIH